ncbi:hypothetical protein FA13DRAFT_1705450 [Coprinellus micaceus]|uniref:Uncharacterized protein n=1 Tax=Coprinellus micaceus TaxID=71717 RepID=A0A4Y7TUB8_COPMI|nr:hypothetical protein FA13DRAFT_1705450 [Coprinellus micaceus]
MEPPPSLLPTRHCSPLCICMRLRVGDASVLETLGNAASMTLGHQRWRVYAGRQRSAKAAWRLRVVRWVVHPTARTRAQRVSQSTHLLSTNHIAPRHPTSSMKGNGGAGDCEHKEEGKGAPTATTDDSAMKHGLFKAIVNILRVVKGRVNVNLEVLRIPGGVIEREEGSQRDQLDDVDFLAASRSLGTGGVWGVEYIVDSAHSALVAGTAGEKAPKRRETCAVYEIPRCESGVHAREQERVRWQDDGRLTATVTPDLRPGSADPCRAAFRGVGVPFPKRWERIETLIEHFQMNNAGPVQPSLPKTFTAFPLPNSARHTQQLLDELHEFLQETHTRRLQDPAGKEKEERLVQLTGTCIVGMIKYGGKAAFKRSGPVRAWFRLAALRPGLLLARDELLREQSLELLRASLVQVTVTSPGGTSASVVKDKGRDVGTEPPFISAIQMQVDERADKGDLNHNGLAHNTVGEDNDDQNEKPTEEPFSHRHRFNEIAKPILGGVKRKGAVSVSTADDGTGQGRSKRLKIEGGSGWHMQGEMVEGRNGETVETGDNAQKIGGRQDLKGRQAADGNNQKNQPRKPATPIPQAPPEAEGGNRTEEGKATYKQVDIPTTPGIKEVESTLPSTVPRHERSEGRDITCTIAQIPAPPTAENQPIGMGPTITGHGEGTATDVATPRRSKRQQERVGRKEGGEEKRRAEEERKQVEEERKRVEEERKRTEARRKRVEAAERRAQRQAEEAKRRYSILRAAAETTNGPIYDLRAERVVAYHESQPQSDNNPPVIPQQHRTATNYFPPPTKDRPDHCCLIGRCCTPSNPQRVAPTSVADGAPLRDPVGPSLHLENVPGPGVDDIGLGERSGQLQGQSPGLAPSTGLTLHAASQTEAKTGAITTETISPRISVAAPGEPWDPHQTLIRLDLMQGWAEQLRKAARAQAQAFKERRNNASAGSCAGAELPNAEAGTNEGYRSPNADMGPVPAPASKSAFAQAHAPTLASVSAPFRPSVLFSSAMTMTVPESPSTYAPQSLRASANSQDTTLRFPSMPEAEPTPMPFAFASVDAPTLFTSTTGKSINLADASCIAKPDWNYRDCGC